MKLPDEQGGGTSPAAVYGELALIQSHDRHRKDEPIERWRIEGKAMMLAKLKRIFARPAQSGPVRLDATPANAEELLWFLQRYPLAMSPPDRARLEADAATGIATRDRMRELRERPAAAVSGTVKTLLPLRSYQVAAVEILAARKRLLVGDDLGLGKTAIALGAHAAGMGPTIVVCQTHLQQQWKREAEKFLFGVRVHVAKKRSVYELPDHDFLIVPYSKVSGWGDVLAEGGYGLVVFDEAQELRRPDSAKSVSCRVVSEAVPHALGLTATPIYNYGEEIHHVGSAIDPEAMGSFEEFTREWCTGIFGRHWAVRDPEMLREWLVDELGLFLRRRRADVSRELPPVTKVIETVPADPSALEQVKGTLARLAETVLHAAQWNEKGMAARELDLQMRQATGIAKAPAVAQFVIERVMAGEKVLLGGWHRAVYDVWMAMFEAADKESRFESPNRRCRAVMYTGSESATKKQAAVDAFVNGEAEVMILSLRSGAGLDGLQRVSDLVVFGEVDWSPQVHDQFVGRLNRDGQQGAVTAVYLVCDEGSDPTIAAVLGIKREQSDGIVDGATSGGLVAGVSPEMSRASALAREVLGGGSKEMQEAR